MILTIAGADFLGANIGQNNSVTITLNNGSKSSVTLKKDESVSTETVIATGLSLQTGYENLVVTVTMTGTGDVSGWYSNGVVTIPSDTLITGNITIKATASKIATGGGEVVDPEEPGTGGDVEISEVQIEVTLVENSYIPKETGELVTNATYKNWTATDYISVNANEKYKVIANTFTGTSSGVGAAVYGYDSNKTPLVCILGEYDASAGTMFSIPENVKYIRVGTIKTKSDISLFKLNIPDDLPEISWIADQYVSKETTGTTPVAAGTIKTASGWSTTNYIDVSKYKKLSYTATIPTGGISSVHCVYGYDSNKNPIKPILTPTSESNTFNNYLIEIVDSDIAYIVACGHSKTLVPSISFTN